MNIWEVLAVTLYSAIVLSMVLLVIAVLAAGKIVLGLLLIFPVACLLAPVIFK